MIKFIIILALIYLIVSRLDRLPFRQQPAKRTEENSDTKNNLKGEYVDYEEVE